MTCSQTTAPPPSKLPKVARGKRIKPTLKASFTSTGFSCIANIRLKTLKRHCSAKELSTLCADHVVLIVGLDLSSKNEADHTVDIKIHGARTGAM
nr:hypothetical protein [Tanacetum cinerariifolium]